MRVGETSVSESGQQQGWEKEPPAAGARAKQPRQRDSAWGKEKLDALKFTGLRKKQRRKRGKRGGSNVEVLGVGLPRDAASSLRAVVGRERRSGEDFRKKD